MSVCGGGFFIIIVKPTASVSENKIYALMSGLPLLIPIAPDGAQRSEGMMRHYFYL